MVGLATGELRLDHCPLRGVEAIGREVHRDDRLVFGVLGRPLGAEVTGRFAGKLERIACRASRRCGRWWRITVRLGCPCVTTRGYVSIVGGLGTFIDADSVVLS